MVQHQVALLRPNSQEDTTHMDRSSRNLWIGLGILVFLLVIASSWGGGMMLRPGMVGPFGVRPFVGAPGLMGVWGIGVLVRLLFFGGLIFLLVRLFRGRARFPASFEGGAHLGLTPDEILRRRYAAGEISREQYEEMRRTLEPTSA
jgi:putative membrane protein